MKPAISILSAGAEALLGALALRGGEGGAAGPPAGEANEFTAEERAWIAAHPVIRAGHDPTYSPYAMLDAAGQLVGIDPDYLELIARQTGLKFQNEVRGDWGQMLADFQAGQVDLLLSLDHAADREPYLIYTRS